APLGELCSLRVGFATLKDRAFLVHETNVGVAGTLPTGVEFQIEPEITRPATKIAEFDDEGQLITNRRRIIFPYEKETGSYRPMREVKLAARFPNCYAFLESWKAE